MVLGKLLDGLRSFKPQLLYSITAGRVPFIRHDSKLGPDKLERCDQRLNTGYRHGLGVPNRILDFSQVRTAHGDQ